MVTKMVLLHFNEELIDKPIVYHLIKDYGLSFNIIKAQIIPQEEGVMLLEIKGREADYKRGMQYLKREGVTIHPFDKRIRVDKDKCVDCGTCVNFCPSGALVILEGKLEYKKEKCIACGVCVNVCIYQAIEFNNHSI